MEVYPLTITSPDQVADFAIWWKPLPNRTEVIEGESYSEYIERRIDESLKTFLARDPSVTDGKLEVFTIKDISPADRSELKLPISGRAANAVTHIVLHSTDWVPSFYLYRVTEVMTRTITATSVRFAIELDHIGTATLQTMPNSVGEVRGNWTTYIKNLGERSKPHTQPMGVVKSLSAPLPTIPKWKQYSDSTPVPLVFVKITGVENGRFKTFACLCVSDPNLRVSVPAKYDSGTDTVYYYPQLNEIVNEPQTATPFTTSESILDISVSARSPVPILAVEGASTPLDLSAEFLESEFLVVDGDITEIAGTGTIRTCWSALTDMTYGLSQDYDIPATGSVPWSLYPMVEMDLRDMMGNVISNVDTQWWSGARIPTEIGSSPDVVRPKEAYAKAYGEPTTVSGLRLRCSITSTSIMNSLIYPDGSHVEWPEGHLPFNTSAYKDYLATMQRYDREMLDIAVQEARGQTIVNSASSLINGALVGALTGSGPVGLVTGAVGVVSNVLGNEIQIAAKEQELVAKQGQLQLMPDKCFVGSSDEEYLDGFKAKLEGGAVDMITVKLPTDSWYYAWNYSTNDYTDMVWSWSYREFYAKSHYAGGRYAILRQDDTFYESNVKFVKLDRIQMMDLLTDRGDGWSGRFPQWMERVIIDILRAGVWLYAKDRGIE